MRMKKMVLYAAGCHNHVEQNFATTAPAMAPTSSPGYGYRDQRPLPAAARRAAATTTTALHRRRSCGGRSGRPDRRRHRQRQTWPALHRSANVARCAVSPRTARCRTPMTAATTRSLRRLPLGMPGIALDTTETGHRPGLRGSRPPGPAQTKEARRIGLASSPCYLRGAYSLIV